MSKVEIWCDVIDNRNYSAMFNVEVSDLTQLLLAKQCYLTLHSDPQLKALLVNRDYVKISNPTKVRNKLIETMNCGLPVFVSNSIYKELCEDFKELQNIADYKKLLQDQIDARICTNRQILNDIRFAEASKYNFERLYDDLYARVATISQEIDQLMHELNSLHYADSLVRVTAAMGGRTIEII